MWAVEIRRHKHTNIRTYSILVLFFDTHSVRSCSNFGARLDGALVAGMGEIEGHIDKDSDGT